MPKRGLTLYPVGSLRELSHLSFPLILSLFSSYLCLFCDRFFLANYSVRSMKACVVAGGLLLIFQRFCVHLASMTQAFVAQYKGAKQEAQAGQFTWQMVWFSLLSSVLIIPLGLMISHVFFKNCEVRDEAQTYFNYMLYGNCFLALECTFTSFYAGIGRTKLIFWFHLLSHGLNIILNAVLIFGVGSWIPSLGIHGAAIGTLLSKVVASLCFGLHFITKYRGTEYQVENITFDWSLMKGGLAKGLSRAFSIVLILIQWNIIAYFMIEHGGNYLLALSFGTSLFLPFFSEAISQGVVVITSYLIGTRLLHKLWAVVKSSLILNGAGLLVIALPLLVFPQQLIAHFFSTTVPVDAYGMLTKVCYWVWLLYVCNSIYLVVFSLAMAFKETLFFLVMNILGMFFWTYLPIYYALQVYQARPDMFWLLVAVQPLCPAAILLIMLYRKHFRKCDSEDLATS